MSFPQKRILVLGSGNFGSCLADHLADADEQNNVQIYSRSKAVIESFNTHHLNPHYLKSHIFSPRLKAIGPILPSPTQIEEDVDVIIFAIPTQAMRGVLESLELNKVENVPLLIFVNKGIEIGTNALPLQVIEEVCGSKVSRSAVFLSGPSFAKEIIQRQPTQVSVASFSALDAENAARLFHKPWFRCYVNPDPIGLELAGALKNCYAIASGVASGLGYEANTRAGLVTRALAEMTRIGVDYGADPITFLGLAGVGDLFLTCSSEKSRNFTVGYKLGKGEKLQTILKDLGSVAEGVDTTKSAYAMTRARGISAPILEHVYELLWENGNASELAKGLMSIPMMEENQGLKSMLSSPMMTPPLEKEF